MNRGIDTLGEVSISGDRSITVMYAANSDAWMLKWPSRLPAKAAVQTILDTVRGGAQSQSAIEANVVVFKDQAKDVVFMSPEEYQDADIAGAYPPREPIARLNVSYAHSDEVITNVILVGDRGNDIELQGIFLAEYGDLANRIIEATVIPEGRGKTAEIAALAISYGADQ